MLLIFHLPPLKCTCDNNLAKYALKLKYCAEMERRIIITTLRWMVDFRVVKRNKIIG